MVHKVKKLTYVEKKGKYYVLVPFIVEGNIRDVLMLTPTEYERGIKRPRKLRVE